MGSMSRRLSRTLIKALVKHEVEAIRRFASLSVRIQVLYLRRESELTVRRRFVKARASTLRITRQSSNQPLRSSCRSKTPTICAAYLVSFLSTCRSRHNLSASIDPQNSGVLIVRLEGGTAAEQVRDRGGVMLGADDITRRLDRKDESCIIM
jgi:hypothetical protein